MLNNVKLITVATNTAWLPDLTITTANLKIVFFLEREAKLMQSSKLESVVSTKVLCRASICPVSIHYLWHNAINQTFAKLHEG